jgi:hypothetical protein
MITLPLHTSHALQPLNLSCFKPFKTSLRKVRDATLSMNNHMEPNMITSVGCVNQALKQSFTKQTSNLSLELQVHGFWTQICGIHKHFVKTTQGGIWHN